MRWSPRTPGLAWCGFSLLLMAGTLIARMADPLQLDWQPSLAASQPWRWWSGVFVHYSTPHLIGNLLATVLVAAFGWAARAPLRATGAWLAAWPLMHLALGIQPDLRHYGGLSGLMHAGVAVATLHLVAAGSRRERTIAGIVLAMLIVKVLTETPWRGAVQRSADWDIPLAPIGHATGLVAGLCCSMAVEWWAARRSRPGA